MKPDMGTAVSPPRLGESTFWVSVPFFIWNAWGVTGSLSAASSESAWWNVLFVLVGGSVAFAALPEKVDVSSTSAKVMLAVLAVMLLGLYVATAVACTINEWRADWNEYVVWIAASVGHIAGWALLVAAVTVRHTKHKLQEL